MRSNYLSFLLLAMLLFIGFLGSCKKQKEAAEIPFIEFLEAPFVDDSIAVKIHFIDGDGDIGFNPGDLDLPLYACNPDPVTNLCTNVNAYNVRVTYYEFENGEWFIPMPQPGINGQLKTITPEGQDKYLEGDLTYKITTNLNSISPSNDSIKFDMVLVDRALNVSNVIETPLIVIP